MNARVKMDCRFKDAEGQDRDFRVIDLNGADPDEYINSINLNRDDIMRWVVSPIHELTVVMTAKWSAAHPEGLANRTYVPTVADEHGWLYVY